jgi:hypothetical protein
MNRCNLFHCQLPAAIVTFVEIVAFFVAFHLGRL